jgi:manganese transport protein
MSQDAMSQDAMSQDAAGTLSTCPGTWQFERGGQARPILGLMTASVPVPRGGLRLCRFLAFLGPGYMVCVGYMDPGNWATDLAGGSKFGCKLISVTLLSNLTFAWSPIGARWVPL